MRNQLATDITERAILVEGPEDQAFIETYIHLLGLGGAFREVGGHIVVCFGKSEIVKPLVVCRQLDIPCVAVFDADGDSTEKNRERSSNERQNLSILRCLGNEDVGPFPSSPVLTENAVIWPTNIRDMVKSEVGVEEWNENAGRCRSRFGNIGGLSKNPLFLADVLAELFESGHCSESLENALKLICDAN